MPKVDVYLDEKIGEALVKRQELEKKLHRSSGRLSASMLGQPLQWQILKLIGVPEKVIEPYVLRKFERGKQVEDWIVSRMPGVIDTQVKVLYRETVGHIDAVVDTSDYNFPVGDIPHEVKSVTNMKFKRIMQTKEADKGHKLQATLYAMGMDVPHYAIDYIASDDFRIYSVIYDTDELAKEVDAIIDAVESTLASGVIPPFEPKESWQANLQYCNYPEWMSLDYNAAEEKLEKEFPEAFNKLKSKKGDK